MYLCFVWISEQTAIISLYSINWLVCITERECVYCAVRARSSTTIQIHLSLQHSPTVKTASSLPLTAETSVWSEVSPSEIVVDKAALWQRYPQHFSFYCQYHSTNVRYCHIMLASDSVDKQHAQYNSSDRASNGSHDSASFTSRVQGQTVLHFLYCPNLKMRVLWHFETSGSIQPTGYLMIATAILIIPSMYA